MTFTSPLFLGYVLVCALLVQALTGPVRLAAILLASAIFASSYIASPLAALPLIAFALAGYGGVWIAQRRRVGSAIAWVTLALVTVFVWLKHYPFVASLPVLPFSYTVIGLSYILFRILHLIFEVGGGAIERPPFVRYCAYLFFFPAFLSGPINRYEPFARDLDAPAQMDDDTAFLTVWRLTMGYAKVAAIGEVIHIVQQAAATRLDIAMASSSVPVLALCYAIATSLYLLFLYANFSGYTDMAIAIARLFGIVLPENFNKPFMATNFQDFWSRWHITLSEWFRYYFFNPLLKVMMQRIPSVKLAPYIGVAAQFIVFVVLGAWHGASWEFMLTGVLLATGVATNKLYQVEITRWIGKKPYRTLSGKPLYIWSARGLSLSWCALSIAPFWQTISEIAALWTRMGLAGFALSIIIMAVAYALGVLSCLRILQIVGAKLPTKANARTVLLAATMVLLAFAVPLIGAQSEFVYKAF